MTSVNAEAVLLRRHHTRVNFRGCGNLTDAAAEHLAQCPLLQTVNFYGCGNLTDAAAERFAQSRQLADVVAQPQNVYFEGCRPFPNESAEQPEQEEQQQDEQLEQEEQQRDESKLKERNRGNGDCRARRDNRRAKQHEARLALAKEIVQKMKTKTNTPSVNMPAKSMEEFLCRAFWQASVEMAG